MKKLDEPTQKLKELYRLSRLARFTGIISGLTGTALLALTIISAGNKGFTILSLILAVIVGFIWHRSVKLVSVGNEMRNFSSFEDYLEHVKEQIRKEDEDRKNIDNF